MNQNELAARLTSIGDADDLTAFTDAFGDEYAEAAREIAEAALRGAGPTIYPWVLLVAGRFGDDHTVHLLGDWVVRATHPNERSEQLGSPDIAKLVAETFVAIDSIPAIAQIQHIRSHCGHHAFADAAARALRDLADARALRTWELEDQVVPTCGLEKKGSTAFKVGEREFTLHLNERLQPYLRDRETLESHTDLPDGADPQEVKRWALVRANIEDTVPYQARRIEQALVTQMRWRQKHWIEYLLHHPLMGYLAERVVWGAYSSTGGLRATFRVEEGGTFIGPDEDDVELDEEWLIGVVHPSQIGEEDLNLWGQQLSDYGVVTLCPQLDRPILKVPKDERKSHGATIGVSVPNHFALPWLVQRGWQTESADRWYSEISKEFRTVDTLVHFRASANDDPIEITDVGFRRFLGYPKTDFQLRDVDPVVYSEVLSELKRLQDDWESSK